LHVSGIQWIKSQIYLKIRVPHENRFSQFPNIRCFSSQPIHIPALARASYFPDIRGQIHVCEFEVYCQNAPKGVTDSICRKICERGSLLTSENLKIVFKKMSKNQYNGLASYILEMRTNQFYHARVPQAAMRTTKQT
jgi:hypothetical protein